jgi:hypothetical protein
MANKKINQLVAKTTILSTDLFPLGDASTGQLFKKTVAELQAAIGGAVISVNGLVGTVVLDTDDIQELATPTNKYFTDARARGAISLTVTGNSGASTYNSSTGVLNVPTYTLAGLGGITATFLSGASGIAYNSSTGVITYTGTVFTDASIRALVSAGAGLSYNSSTGVFSYSGTVYTDASIRALISLTTTGNSGVSSYNNTTGVLNVPNYTLAGLGGISLTSLSGTAPITYNSTTGAIGITQANTSTNGFLSSTDWNTFNGKQSALTLGNVTEVASNVLLFPDGGTNKTVGNLSIQVVQSGASTNGYLSSTDWTTFNNKQATVTLTTTGTTGASTFSAGTLNIPQYQGAITLTTTGTSGAATLTSNTLNIPQYQAVLTNPVTGTGTAGHVAYWSGSGTITGEAALFYDATNDRLGIGTASPATRLHVSGNVSGGFVGITIKNTSTGTNASQMSMQTNSQDWFLNVRTDNHFSIYNNTAATTPFIITTGGNVGVSTESPAGKFAVNTGASNQVAFVNNATTNGTYNIISLNGAYSEGTNMSIQGGGSGDANLYVNSGYTSATSGAIVFRSGGASAYTERMRINSGGQMLVGDTSIAYTNAQGYIAGFKSASTSQTFISIARSGQTLGSSGLNVGLDTSAAYFFLCDNLPINFSTNESTKVQITAGGNMLLGTLTDNGERLYVSGSIRATGSITANSDVRLKKNIERIENALQKVSEISGYTYNTIYDEDRHAGVIAQEIDKVLPEIVNKGNDGLMGVEYGNISALLIEAIKEQKVLIESLQAKVEALSK